jgi:hypothetical protein
MAAILERDDTMEIEIEEVQEKQGLDETKGAGL